MFARFIAPWKQSPFLRCLLPLMTGIIVQWHVHLPAQWSKIVLATGVFALASQVFMSGFARYQFAMLTGLTINFIFASIGALIVWGHDVRNRASWCGNIYSPGDMVIGTLVEPPEEKANSFKALARIAVLRGSREIIPCSGIVFIYFQKDSFPPLNPGSRIEFSTPLQEIRNTSNPGGFDYKEYCVFQGITHQVYLAKQGYMVLKPAPVDRWSKGLVLLRNKVLRILKRYIPGEKQYGLAEALLIGYRDDLDKNLVQAYTRTGVVHIIAISGMHIALIYWLLALVCKPFRKLPHARWLATMFIIAGLWLFSLLAGAGASVVRSAVMFTFIVIGDNFSKKTQVYNSLFGSAFMLLCYNPFWLWDVGFQLSYAAVLSIVIFSKPVYSCLYIKNKIADFAWRLIAVSIAAQLLTTSLSIYHFHQFPNYFLLTNIVAVPLSGVIVVAEIFLCILATAPVLASIAGKMIAWLIWIMNTHIERIEALPGSLFDGLQIDVLQALLLSVIVVSMGYWSIEKKRHGAWIALGSLLLFMCIRSVSFILSGQTAKIIIYNIPRHEAIDIAEGRDCYFITDTSGIDLSLQQFYLKPTRILYRLKPRQVSGKFLQNGSCVKWHGETLLFVNGDFPLNTAPAKTPVDFLIISKGAKLNLVPVLKRFNVKQVIFDASASPLRTKLWMKDCDSLHTPCYNVSDRGAFVINLN